MSHFPRVALAACTLVVFAELSLLLLVGSNGSVYIAFPAVLASAALVCVILMTRSMSRDDFGSAIAWGYSGLPAIAALFLFQLPLLHLSRLVGTAQCDAMAGDCGPAPVAYWIPFVLNAAALVVTWIAVRHCKRSARAI